VIGTVLWVAIAAAAVAWEVAGRLGRRRHAGLGGVLGRICAGRFGRVVLLLVWGFLGIHVFARYTIPHVG
jgi:hypothetical protein